MTRQDGPLLVGALNENSNVPKPLKVNNAGELLVTSGGGGGTSDVNLVEVGGAAIALGQAAMAASLPVVVASNQTAIPISGSVTTGGLTDTQLRATPVPVSGTVTATQGTATNLKAQAESYQGGSAVGSGNPLQVTLANTGANATAVKVDGTGGTFPIAGTVAVTQSTSPWIVAGGGTAGTAASGVATIQGIASMTPVQVSQATASSLNAQVVGSIASDGVDSGNPIKIGYKAATAAPSAVAAGDRVDALGDVWGRAYMRSGEQAPVASTFTQVHIPSTNVQATKTQASAGSGKRNVCTGFTVTLCAGASAITAAAPLTVMVVDGATGGTTYLWRSYINIPAAAGAQVSIVRTGLWLVGSQATALTVEFSAAGGTNSYESVAFDGVVVEE